MGDHPGSAAASGLSRIPTAVWVLGFTGYSWAVTTVCAAWFLRRVEPVDLWRSLAWEGAIYAAWLPAAGVIWLVFRRFGTGVRTAVAMLALGAVTAPLEALASTWIDAAFRGRDPHWPGALERLPVAILLFTAIAAVGLAAVHHRRLAEARAQAERLEAALAEARRATPAPARLMVSAGSRRIPVDLAEVEWFGAAGNYVVVHWAEREGLVRETLQALEGRLDPLVFARSHRSTIVNLARVQETQSLSDGSWRLVLRSGAELVASRTYRDEILRRLGR